VNHVTERDTGVAYPIMPLSLDDDVVNTLKRSLACSRSRGSGRNYPTVIPEVRRPVRGPVGCQKSVTCPDLDIHVRP
jgi:hypothetical protein